MLDAGHQVPAVTGQCNNVREQSLEHEFHGCLQCAAASDAIHATLSAAHGCCDLAKARCCTAVVGIATVRIEGKLRGIAQLEGVETGLDSSFTIESEALEYGEIVLNISGSAERVSSRIT